jgi:WD40 repeat protein
MSRTVALVVLWLLTPVALAAPAGNTPRDENLPEGAVYRIGVPRLRHGGSAVICVAFSPDGKVLASVGNDNLGKIWDVATGKLLVELKGHNSGVQGCAFTPDGKQLLTCSMDGTLKLWDVATGKDVRTFTGHQGPVLPVAVSPDGKLGASEGQDATVRVWDLATGKELRNLPGHESQGTTNLAFTPNNKGLVTVGQDFTLRLWNLDNGKESLQFKGHTADVNSIEFSPDGKQLISASSDKTVKLWNTTTGQVLKTFAASENMVSTARFCPDGKTMLCGGVDRVLRLWDLGTGKEVRRFYGNRRTVSEVTVTPDGKIAATAGHDGVVRLWDIATGQELPHSGGAAEWADVSPDGKVLATGGGNWVRFWDPATGKPLAGTAPLDQHGGIVRIAYGDNKTLAVLSDDGTVKIWDLGTCKVIREVILPTVQAQQLRIPHSLGFIGDGKLVAAASWDASASWEVATGKDLTRPFQTEEAQRDGTLRSLVLSRDGRFAATMNDQADRSAVRIWDAATGQELRSFSLIAAGTDRLTISADGRTLATAAGQPTVKLWETATGLERARLPQPAALATVVVTSGDGRLAAAADFEKFIHVYDVVQGKEIAKFSGLTDTSSTLMFLPANKALVSVGDGSVITWDLGDALKKMETLRLTLEAKELDTAWSDLSSDDGVKAYAAVWALAGAAEQALPLVKDRLNKAQTNDEVKKVPEWIKDLDSDEFALREKATKQLERLGRLAEQQLRETLQKKPSLEVKLRVERILERLKQMGGTPNELQALRAVEVLEKVGSAEAKKLLQTLAEGPAEAVATREAKAALARLGN